MSYCRWSCDDFQSDIYCYEASDGVVIDVASRRRVPVEPLPPPLAGPFDVVALVARQTEVMAICDRSPFVDLDFPGAGESYTGLGYAEALEILDQLRQAGANVPEHAFEGLREDLAAELAEAQS